MLVGDPRGRSGGESLVGSAALVTRAGGGGMEGEARGPTGLGVANPAGAMAPWVRRPLPDHGRVVARFAGGRREGGGGRPSGAAQEVWGAGCQQAMLGRHGWVASAEGRSRLRQPAASANGLGGGEGRLPSHAWRMHAGRRVSGHGARAALLGAARVRRLSGRSADRLAWVVFGVASGHAGALGRPASEAA